MDLLSADLLGDRPKLTVWLDDVVEKKGRFGGNS